MVSRKSLDAGFHWNFRCQIDRFEAGGKSACNRNPGNFDPFSDAGNSSSGDEGNLLNKLHQVQLH